MRREITLSKYPHEVRLALLWAARFLTRIDLPIPTQLDQARFIEALRQAFAKLEDPDRHDVLPAPEARALHIVVNFAMAQVHEALGRLRQVLRGITRASRREARIAKVSAG